MRLQDKVILVTGSTTGIGEGMARRFAREGAKVLVHGRREPAGREVVGEIRAAGGEASFLEGDLGDPEVPQRLIDSVLTRHGRIDALVNNAAITSRATLETTGCELFDRIVAVNVRAPLLLIQAALPHFRKAGGGRVLNIGSCNAYSGERNLLPYSISKGGLMTLSKNLADAHAHEGIRVNLFNIGWVLTENERELKKKEGFPDDWPEKVSPVFAPSGRLLHPEDIAAAAVYILSDEAPLLSGAVLDFEQYPFLGRNPPKDTL